MAGLLVPMGALAGLVGNRRVLLVVLLVFGIASLLAVFAPTPVLLIGSRVSLALGGSMIMPCVLGLIRRAFEDERAMTLGLWGTVGTAGAGLHDFTTKARVAVLNGSASGMRLDFPGCSDLCAEMMISSQGREHSDNCSALSLEPTSQRRICIFRLVNVLMKVPVSPRIKYSVAL